MKLKTSNDTAAVNVPSAKSSFCASPTAKETRFGKRLALVAQAAYSCEGRSGDLGMGFAFSYGCGQRPRP